VVGQTIYNWEKDGPPEGRIPEIEEILGPLTKKKQAPSDADETEFDPTEDEISSFGVWMRRRREELDLTRPELARKAHLAYPTVYFIESGRIKNPQAATKDKLLHLLGPMDDGDDTDDENRIQGIGSVHEFNPKDEEDQPSCPGVYVLYSRTRRPVYVGKAGSIHNRITTHDHTRKYTKRDWWFMSPLVEYGAYIEVKDKKLRDQVEKVMMRFLKNILGSNERNTKD
jgi:transcriptional regulator with XRE-family HTH domain